MICILPAHAEHTMQFGAFSHHVMGELPGTFEITFNILVLLTAGDDEKVNLLTKAPILQC